MVSLLFFSSLLCFHPSIQSSIDPHLPASASAPSSSSLHRGFTVHSSIRPPLAHPPSMPVHRENRSISFSPSVSPYHRQPLQHRLASPLTSPTSGSFDSCAGSLSGSSYGPPCSPPTSLSAFQEGASSTFNCTSASVSPAGPFRYGCSATSRGGE